jgi:hypothetical protein
MVLFILDVISISMLNNNYYNNTLIQLFLTFIVLLLLNVFPRVFHKKIVMISKLKVIETSIYYTFLSFYILNSFNVAKLLQCIRPHENVVGFQGVAFDDNKIMIVLEYLCMFYIVVYLFVC